MITEPIEPVTPGDRVLAGAFARWNDERGGALVGLPEFPFPVMVSASERPAGERIARRADTARRVLKRILGVEARLSLVVLSRRDWSAHAEVSAYGVTHRARDGRLIVGAEPAAAWHAVSDYFGSRLSTRARAELIAVHGVDASNGRGPDLSALAETLIAHEIAHLCAAQAGIAFPRRWLEEAFANHALVAVLGETDAAGLRRVTSLAEAGATLDDALPTLAEFEANFGSMDVIPSVLAELAITRSAYVAHAVYQAKPLARLFAAFRDARLARDADYELGRMLATRVHPSIAAIPLRFACAGVGIAA